MKSKIIHILKHTRFDKGVTDEDIADGIVMIKGGIMDKETMGEIKQGLKEISEGKVVSLSLMEKRQEIREGMAIKLWLEFGESVCPQCKSWGLCPHQQRYLDASDYLTSFLDSQGVVIKE